MARRMTLILVLGMLCISLALASVSGYLLRNYIHRQFTDLGSQNAILGSKITEYIIEKAVDNGLFDKETLFNPSYQPIVGSVVPRFRADFDYYFDMNVKTILNAFLVEANIYYAYVINQDGYIPAHTDKDMVKVRLDPDQDIPAEVETAGGVYRVIHRDGRGYDFYEYRAPISIDERHWGEFRVGIPIALVGNSVIRNVAGTFILTLVLALSIGGLMLRLIIRGLRPLAELTEATRRMAAGDLTVRCTYGGKDEIGTLARSFNVMAGTLAQSHEWLDHQVQERTAELRVANEGLQGEIRERKETERRLQVTMEAAQMASRAKGEFLANMSHEIRTPLNGILGMTGLLLDLELGSEQREYGKIILSSGENLLTLINDILDFSKVEARKLEMETLDFELPALLDDFASMLALRALDKGLELVCTAEPDVPVFLRGDPGRLRQVLTNLAGNAIKFTAQGEVVIRVGLVESTGGEVLLRFSVRDSGIGIPKGKQEVLFKPFSQVDASTTRKYGGTGLGLAISKELAEFMGGGIGVNSEDGKGSEFWFTVRLQRQPSGGAGGPAIPWSGGGRILVVDDNGASRSMLLDRLRAWGLRVEGTADGAAALGALLQAQEAGDPYRGALLDLQMPVMDGKDLCVAIKADPRIAQTRLVLMLPLTHKGSFRWLEPMGFSGCLPKPVRQTDLLEVLRSVLGSAAMPPSAEPDGAVRKPAEASLGNARILLAEDNITNQKVAVGILRKFGLKADAVANGAEAVKALENLPYDLVLMDVQMPEMDGLEATRWIRSAESAVRDHKVAIIAMTAHAMLGDREKCLEAGMDDYISKPVSAQAIRAVLQKWLNRPASAAVEAVPAPAREGPASGP